MFEHPFPCSFNTLEYLIKYEKSFFKQIRKPNNLSSFLLSIFINKIESYFSANDIFLKVFETRNPKNRIAKRNLEANLVQEFEMAYTIYWSNKVKQIRKKLNVFYNWPGQSLIPAGLCKPLTLGQPFLSHLMMIISIKKVLKSTQREFFLNHPIGKMTMFGSIF